MQDFENFVQNQFQKARAGGTYHAPDAFDALAEIPDSGLLDLAMAMPSANKAQAEWAALPIDERTERLRRLLRELQSRQTELVAAEAAGVQTAPDLILNGSVVPALRRAELAISQGGAATLLRSPHTRQMQHPLGVVAILLSAYQAFEHTLNRLIPALLLGNAVILKPSSHGLASLKAFALAVAASDLPSGLIQIIFGRGDDIGQALCTHPGIDAVCFVGKTETGLRVLQNAAETLKRVHLATGAANTGIVFQDADLGKFGPEIISQCLQWRLHPHHRIHRLFVQESIYEQFSAEILNVLRQRQPERPLRRSQFESFANAVTLAKQENGKILTAETPHEPGFMIPTALSQLTQCSTLQQADIQAPVFTVYSFKYLHDALKYANTSPFGQRAYVWTNDQSRIDKLGQNLMVGEIIVNSETSRNFDSDPDISHEAFKQSGWGGGLSGGDWLRFFQRHSIVRTNS